MPTRGDVSIAVDIGGTFTDIVILKHRTGELANVKVPTTPSHPERGVDAAIRQAIEVEGLSPRRTKTVLYATTIASNALLGQAGLELPKTCLITTKGFRDVLEIGRQRRPELYNVFVQRPKPLIERKFRFEVDERVDYEGHVLRPLRSGELRKLGRRLARQRFDAAAISFLHSYANPKHERLARRVLRSITSIPVIVTSEETLAEFREFERTSTTVVNTVLMPLVARYLREMRSLLRAREIGAPLFIMKSSGACSSLRAIASEPSRMVESGPAAGVVAAGYLASALGFERAISFDMGGTTAKAGLVVKGEPSLTTDYEVGGKVHAGRILSGSGYPVRFPFIDLAECGAGGGSIARVDSAGALLVGPESAGAEPGPACYGRGGKDPTITDANLILGRINPSYLLGGGFRLQSKLSYSAVAKYIAKPLKLQTHEAAAGIVKVANSLMARIIRIVSVEKGIDPRNFRMVAFGGAGPLHACALADEFQITRIVVPPNPGLFSAFGLLAAPVAHDRVKTKRVISNEAEPELIRREFKHLEHDLIRTVKREGVAPRRILIKRWIDARYEHQAYELRVPLSFKDLAGNVAEVISRRFHALHEKTYGFRADAERVELVNFRVEASVPPSTLRFFRVPFTKGRPRAKATRKLYLINEKRFTKCPIYQREELGLGLVLRGPAIIEQYDATTFVEPRWRASHDDFGNMVLSAER